MSNLPWTHGDIMLLHIFILLLIWFAADRCKFYFTDIPRYLYMIRLYYGAWRAKPPRYTNSAGPR